MAYRTSIIEKDLSGFVQGTPGSNGAIVVNSRKGPNKPILCQGEDDVVLYFGTPSAEYSDVFEAITYAKSAPCWVVSVIGEEAVYGGIDVKQNSVTPFGEGAGRVSPDAFNYASVNTFSEMSPTGLVNGKNAQFTGTIPNTPIDEGSLVVKIDGEKIVLDDVAGAISGIDINPSGTNTIDYSTGAFDLTLAGVPGSFATATTDVDLTGGIDLSILNTAGYQDISNIGNLASFVGSNVPAIPTQTDYELDIAIDGSTYQLADISITSADNWTTIVSAIQTSLRTATGSTETVTIVDGKIKVMSATKGSTSSVSISAGTAGTGSGDLITAINALGANYVINIESAVAGTDVDYFIKITIDGSVQDNLNLGHTLKTRADIINAINTAFGSVVASINDTGGEFIDFTGAIADNSLGKVKIENPSSGASALSLVFSSSSISTTGVSPTGAIPKVGQTITIGWVYNTDISGVVSHSIFTLSPQEDNLAAEVVHISGQRFKIYLKEIVGNGNYIDIQDYEYSLIREKDNFQRSLYYEDVFRNNPYIKIVVNPSYPGGAYSLNSGIVEFSGGDRGEIPTEAQYQNQWSVFEANGKYPVDIFMDVKGNSAFKLNDLVQNYQKYAFAISVIPIGNNRLDAIDFRTNLGLNSDNIAIYTNWAFIKDPYNNSFAWISQIGGVGAKYAAMADIFNAGSPAGRDEDGHGGLLSDWEVVELEFDYTESDKQALDEAQINPIIKDRIDGIKIDGDKTMQAYLSDTSFIGTRRLYDYIAKTLEAQVLQKQVFRLNDRIHRLTAKLTTEDFLAPILAGGWLNDVYVKCNDKNNDEYVREQRRFIVDIYVQVTPNSQHVQLRITRLSQTQSTAEFRSQ